MTQYEMTPDILKEMAETLELADGDENRFWSEELGWVSIPTDDDDIEDED